MVEQEAETKLISKELHRDVHGEEKEKEEEKYQQEVVFCFHAHAWRCPLTHATNN